MALIGSQHFWKTSNNDNLHETLLLRLQRILVTQYMCIVSTNDNKNDNRRI